MVPKVSEMQQQKRDEKVMIFAPGALYEILPLWVARQSSCEGETFHFLRTSKFVPSSSKQNLPLTKASPTAVAFEDLSRYHPLPTDAGVAAWPIDRTHPDRENRRSAITFTIKAQFLHETDHGRTMRMAWERLRRTVRRQERKLKKKEREAGRKLVEEEGYNRGVKDEL